MQLAPLHVPVYNPTIPEIVMPTPIQHKVRERMVYLARKLLRWTPDDSITAGEAWIEELDQGTNLFLDVVDRGTVYNPDLGVVVEIGTLRFSAYRTANLMASPVGKILAMDSYQLESLRGKTSDLAYSSAAVEACHVLNDMLEMAGLEPITPGRINLDGVPLDGDDDTL